MKYLILTSIILSLFSCSIFDVEPNTPRETVSLEDANFSLANRVGRYNVSEYEGEIVLSRSEGLNSYEISIEYTILSSSAEQSGTIYSLGFSEYIEESDGDVIIDLDGIKEKLGREVVLNQLIMTEFNRSLNITVEQGE